MLSHNAVHAAMAGYTVITLGAGLSHAWHACHASLIQVR